MFIIGALCSSFALVLWGNVTMQLSAGLQFGRIATPPTETQSKSKNGEKKGETREAPDCTFSGHPSFCAVFSGCSCHIAIEVVMLLRRPCFVS